MPEKLKGFVFTANVDGHRYKWRISLLQRTKLKEVKNYKYLYEMVIQRWYEKEKKWGRPIDYETLANNKQHLKKQLRDLMTSLTT